MTLKSPRIKHCLAALALILCAQYGMADSPVTDDKKLSSMKRAYKAEFLATLSNLMGKEINPNDPAAIQASEVYFALDAAKSYAFSRIHGVALEFCPNETGLKNAMEWYKKTAKAQIALGETYYSEGFSLMLGQQMLVKSGQEFTDGLNEILEDIKKEYRNADPEGVLELCRESTKALKVLADFYSVDPTQLSR
jgi:hypothetical protein